MLIALVAGKISVNFTRDKAGYRYTAGGPPVNPSSSPNERGKGKTTNERKNGRAGGRAF